MSVSTILTYYVRFKNGFSSDDQIVTHSAQTSQAIKRTNSVVATMVLRRCFDFYS